MASYTPTIFDIPTGLDETGLMLGLPRMPQEHLATYRKRLLLETRDRSGPSEQAFIHSCGRKVGQFDIPVFEIDVIRDGNDIPLAADPYIEVTSTHIRAYSDWESETLDFELNLVDRNDAYFLREVYTAFTASTFFSISVIDTSYTFKRSDKLRFGSTERFVRSEYLSDSRSNRLRHDFIREIYPQAFQHFDTEVATVAEVDDEGKFYVDYLNGVIITYEPAGGIVSYSYREFPYRLYWQPVRAWPYNDSDKIYRTHDLLVDENGVEQPLWLNSDGAWLANQVIDLHPLGWGK